MSAPSCVKAHQQAGYRGSDGAVCCCLCDNEAEWRDCDTCGGDGFVDAYEDDPINNSPGDDETCRECGGNGGDHLCATAGCPNVTLLSIFQEKPSS